MKIKSFIIFFIIMIFLFIGTITLKTHKKNTRPDVKIPILLFHDFVKTVPEKDPDQFQYINTPESFEENIRTLLDDGYTFISFQELNDAYNEHTKLPGKPILLTMDDGNYSNYEYIFPIIKKYDIKASIFVVTDYIGKTIDHKKYLSWNNCKEMYDSGNVEIFSHSKRHVFYNRLPVRTLRNDVKKSYQEIEKHLGKIDLKVFAYPYGANTKTGRWVLKRNGIEKQVFDLGMNNFHDFNKHYIKRINIPCEMTGKEIIEEIKNSN